MASDEVIPPTRTPLIRSSAPTQAAAGLVPTATTGLQASAATARLPAATSAPVIGSSTPGTTVPTPTAVATAPPSATQAATQGATAGRYTVRQGDTLSGVSRQAGVSVAELAQANGIPPDAGLRTGQVLQLPSSSSWSSEMRIKVNRPTSGASVRTPLIVEGSAATFESMIVVELLDASAASLARTTTRARAGDIGEHSPFRAELEIPPIAAGRAATLRVYWTSPRDGSAADEVRVPVTIAG